MELGLRLSSGIATGRSVLRNITPCPAKSVFIDETMSGSVMKPLGQSRQLRQETDLIETAWWVLQDSRELIQERQAHAAKLKQLIKRRDNILLEARAGNCCPS